MTRRARIAGEPIHEWFELTYANYVVIPRAVLQSMPVRWQRRFVELAEEMRAATAHLDWPEYRVNAVKEGRFVTDPIPNYERGRARVEVRLPAKAPTKRGPRGEL